MTIADWVPTVDVTKGDQEYLKQTEMQETSGPGKYPGYNFWRVAGVQIGGKDKGQSEREDPPTDPCSILP